MDWRALPKVTGKAKPNEDAFLGPIHHWTCKKMQRQIVRMEEAATSMSAMRETATTRPYYTMEMNLTFLELKVSEMAKLVLKLIFVPL